MNLFTQIKSFLQKKSDRNTENAPEGFCPNCWGRQEYGGQFFEAIHQEKIDLNNIDQKKGWIEAYAARYLEGIRLTKEDGSQKCPSCEIVYKPA